MVIIGIMYVAFLFVIKSAPLLIVIGLAIYFTFSKKHKDEPPFEDQPWLYDDDSDK